MQNKIVLVTGGLGYIGSHTVVELLNVGYEVVVIDNLSNSKTNVLNRVEQICSKRPEFYRLDILDKEALREVFAKYKFDAVIHFAALKAVGESVTQPYQYYQNNVSGSLNLFNVMDEFKVKTIVFSSSATVYGEPHTTPITEDFPLTANNPYGWTKLMTEQILKDIYHADQSWSIGVLRYFNPVGAHKSGLIGEDPNGIPNNLMPYISQVAVGKLKCLRVFGNDYPTHDGTGVRDYIHVVDLAHGHLKALEYLFSHNELLTVNLGTGVGYSVLDVVKAFSQACSHPINYIIEPRRAGDVAKCFADPGKANALLNWNTRYNLADMCQDSWNWQKNNPHGYQD